MKRILIAILAIVFLFGCVGCAGIDVKWDNEATISVIQKSATSTVGYLVAKNNKEYIPDLLEWYSTFNNLEEFVDIQTEYTNGIEKLSELISDDPYLQLQIKNVMSVLEINVEGPAIPEDLGKYKAVVDSFMLGVMAVQIN